MKQDIERKLAYTTLISSISFVILLFALHFIQPNLDPTWTFISEYARGDSGWLMSLAFGMLTVTCFSSLVLFWQQARGWAGRIGSVLLGISGIGMLLAALFKTDPINTPMNHMSTSGTLHSIAGQLNLTSFAILFLTINLVKNDRWKQLKIPLWVVVAIYLLVDTAFIASAASAGGSFGPGIYAGLLGRLDMICFVTWITVASMHIIRFKDIT